MTDCEILVLLHRSIDISYKCIQALSKYKSELELKQKQYIKENLKELIKIETIYCCKHNDDEVLLDKDEYTEKYTELVKGNLKYPKDEVIKLFKKWNMDVNFNEKKIGVCGLINLWLILEDANYKLDKNTQKQLDEVIKIIEES